MLDRAQALTGELKPLDATHLATAVMLDAPGGPVTVLTHHARLAKAARMRGAAYTRPRRASGLVPL